MSLQPSCEQAIYLPMFVNAWHCLLILLHTIRKQVMSDLSQVLNDSNLWPWLQMYYSIHFVERNKVYTFI